MNLNINWNKKNYSDFINYLYSLQDIEYKDFHKKLLKDDTIEMIGIRTPVLKKIAKEISKNDYHGFITNNRYILYEEKVIVGFIIGHLKDYQLVINYLNNFLPHINNWAICDLTCSSLKIFKKIDSFNYLKSLIYSNNLWYIRVGIVSILSHYINDKYINDIIAISINIKSNEYYVKTAVSWLLATCYINYTDSVYNVLKSGVLDEFTHNKTIQKIRESFRVNEYDKNKLKLLRK